MYCTFAMMMFTVDVKCIEVDFECVFFSRKEKTEKYDAENAIGFRASEKNMHFLYGTQQEYSKHNAIPSSSIYVPMCKFQIII